MCFHRTNGRLPQKRPIYWLHSFRLLPNSNRRQLGILPTDFWNGMYSVRVCVRAVNIQNWSRMKCCRLSFARACFTSWEQPPINCKWFLKMENSFANVQTSGNSNFYISFCPALTLISKKLQMSEAIAGATLLAFGNASPDLFTAMANYQNDTKMLYAQTFGNFLRFFARIRCVWPMPFRFFFAGGDLFLLGFVAAIICIVSPVSLDPATTFRDMFFLLVTCIWLALAFHDEKFDYFEAIGEDWGRFSSFN